MSIYEIEVETRTGKISMDEYKGKVLLIINSATGCGFTPQYKSLERLYEKYHDRGLEILDFPCDQFGHQAPGSDDEIHEFCSLKYDTKFDQFKKIDVNGDNASELFKYLKKQIGADIINGVKNKLAMKAISKISLTCKSKNDIVWNFTKFLVDRQGNVIKRYSPIENPDIIEADIIKLI